MDNDLEIYKNKKFSDLCKDIVTNSESTRDQLDVLISDLRTFIKTANDALLVVPMIKEYLDIRVKNDEQLVKLAAVVQRLINKEPVGADGVGLTLTDEEKKQLMQEIETIDVDLVKSIPKQKPNLKK